jgi:regulator of RNase E activity RraB
MNTDYPNDSDGDALRRVEAGRSDMSIPMDIDFHVAAPDEGTAKRVADESAKLGYHIKIWFNDLDGKRTSNAWTCQCTKLMVPTYEAIIAVQAELDAIAQPLGAYADGWGTFGNAANPACSPNNPQPQSGSPPGGAGRGRLVE